MNIPEEVALSILMVKGVSLLHCQSRYEKEVAENISKYSHYSVEYYNGINPITTAYSQ